MKKITLEELTDEQLIEAAKIATKYHSSEWRVDGTRPHEYFVDQKYKVLFCVDQKNCHVYIGEDGSMVVEQEQHQGKADFKARGFDPRYFIYLINEGMDLGINDLKPKDFEEAVRPLMQYLCENQHPHMSAHITGTVAELLEGQESVNTEDYLVD